MQELKYPFDNAVILRKKKSLRRKLLSENTKRIVKRIAILGGSSTHDIKDILELFLLDYGIEPQFYESEYGQYWEDAMFPNESLREFSPDIIYVHTSNRNILQFPNVTDSKEEVEELLNATFGHFESMWKQLKMKYKCPIIQNNFELPYYRIFGNRDVVDYRGRSNFIQHLNQKFSEYAENNQGFYINDICWLSATLGIAKWQDIASWSLYKYVPAVSLIPDLSFNIANIIKAIYGKNKKAFVLDLDNTLWGGVIGDDGPEKIEIGQETSVGQVFSEFQQYLKNCQSLGIVLTINSKNEEENALKGLERPDSILHTDDFIIIKANWNPKDRNIRSIAKELNVGEDSLVFIDDNPAERHIVRMGVPSVEVPELTNPEEYIRIIDRSGFFEITDFSTDDLKRNDMYKANVIRSKQQANFENYDEYLLSLEMVGEIRPFSKMYTSRIAQLTNKSNQFNLTTLRCSIADIEQYMNNPDYITLYGKLADKFGDNGLVSVVFGHEDTGIFHIDLWLMSCRVLKRNFEFAMMDALVEKCRFRGIRKIYGYYYPTAKNKMVKDFYAEHKFKKISENTKGESVWEFSDLETYKNMNQVIKVVE